MGRTLCKIKLKLFLKKFLAIRAQAIAMGKKLIYNKLRDLRGNFKMCVKKEVIEDKNEALRGAYIAWFNILSKSGSASSYLLGKDYSNPYYIGVPNDWTDAALKIMIVGKEGYGHWGCGKNGNESEGKPKYCPICNIKEIQDYNLKYVRVQLGKENAEGKGLYTDNSSSRFWDRIRKLREYISLQQGIQKDKISFIWNNMDKIHKIPSKNGGKCVLDKTERQNLHSLNCHILQEEIKITKPNVVIFFGNYWDKKDFNALRAELEGVCNQLMDEKDHWRGGYYKSKWESEHIIWCRQKYGEREIPFVFTYHPNYIRKWGAKIHTTEDGYNKAVVDAVKEALEIKDKP